MNDLIVSHSSEFQRAKEKEIDSYFDHAAVDIASKYGVDLSRVMGWV